MKKIRRMFGNKIFTGFLISYILVFLIPLTIGIIAYKEALKAVDKDEQEVELASLNRCTIALDSRLEEVEKIATQISTDPNVLSLSNEYSPFSDPTVPCKITDLNKKLASFTQNNNFISMTYIHFNKSDVTYFNNNSYLSEDQVYEQFFQYNNMNNVQWDEKVIKGKQYKAYFPAARVMWRKDYLADSWKEQQMLMFKQSFPLGGYDKGQVMILIPTARIEELLSDINYNKKSYVYITDSKSNLLASFSASKVSIDLKDFNFKNDSGFMRKKISGQDMLIMYNTSKFNGWRYISVLPYKVVSERVAYLRNLVYSILSISLITGIIGAFMMSYHNSRPIKGIFEIFSDMFDGKESGNDEGDYRFLRKSILDLVNNNKSMKESINTQFQMLEAVFVEKLISGGFKALDEVQFYLKQLGIKMLKGKLIVAIAHIEQSNEEHGKFMPQEFSAIKILMKDFIEKYLGSDVYYYDLDFDKRIIIFKGEAAGENDEKAYVEGILHNIYTDLEKAQNIRISFATGSFVEDYLGISRSFNEAKEVVEYNTMNIDARVLWYYDIPKKKDNYFYPLDIEKLLINYTKLANEKEVNRIIKRIFKENFEKGSISAAATVHLFNEIQGTILKITDMLEVKHKEEVQIIRLKLNLIDKYKNSEEIFDFIIRVFQELCDISDEGKHSRTETILRITDYLNTNYMDSQLSLTSLADRFNFAPAYLSQLFKEEVGDNFSTYLEKIRIKKACEMLHNGETVNKIAECVGYNDVHVFRNAFKRITGQTPRDYKVKTEPRELFDI